jgi:hypothetical protein
MFRGLMPPGRGKALLRETPHTVSAGAELKDDFWTKQPFRQPVRLDAVKTAAILKSFKGSARR